MTKYFNLARYKELLEVEKAKNIRSLLDPILVELLTLEVSVERQLAYNRRNKYLSLIEKYLIGSIEIYEFRSRFTILKRQDSERSGNILQDFEELEVFQLSDCSKKFSDLTLEISDLCFEDYQPDSEPIPDDEFYNSINDCYTQLQTLVLFDKDLVYDKLIYRSFKILTFVIGLEILLNLS